MKYVGKSYTNSDSGAAWRLFLKSPEDGRLCGITTKKTDVAFVSPELRELELQLTVEGFCINCSLLHLNLPTGCKMGAAAAGGV